MAYEPAVQGDGLAVPAGQYEPAGQGKQSESWLAPVLEEKVPAGQLIGTEALVKQ